MCFPLGPCEAVLLVIFSTFNQFIQNVKNGLEVKEIREGAKIPNVEDIVMEETITEDEEKETEVYAPKQTPENHIRHRQPRSQILSDAKTTECPECGKEFATKTVMLRHYRSVHEGIKYPCNQCDSQFTDRSSLQKHIQSKHEGIKFPCNQCDYQASRQGSLQTHIQSIHEGKKYTCNQCDYQVSYHGDLKKHIQRKHHLY